MISASRPYALHRSLRALCVTIALVSNGLLGCGSPGPEGGPRDRDGDAPRVALREQRSIPSSGAASIINLEAIGCSDDASCPAGAFCHLGRLACMRECTPEVAADESGCSEGLSCDFTGRCLVVARDPAVPRLKVALLGEVVPVRAGPNMAEVSIDMLEAADAPAEQVRIDVFAGPGGEVQCPLDAQVGRGVSAWSDHCFLTWRRDADGEPPRIRVRRVGGGQAARPQVRLSSSSMQPQVTHVSLDEVWADEDSAASAAAPRHLRGTASLQGRSGGGWPVRARLEGDRLVIFEPTRTIFGGQPLAFRLATAAGNTISWLDAERDMQPFLRQGRAYQGATEARWVARDFRLIDDNTRAVGEITVSFGHERDLQWQVELARHEGDDEDWGAVSEGGAETGLDLRNDLLTDAHSQLLQRHSIFGRNTRPRHAWSTMSYKLMEGLPVNTQQDTLTVHLPPLRSRLIFQPDMLLCLDLAGLSERQAHRLSHLQADSPAMCSRNVGEQINGHDIAPLVPWFARKLGDLGLFAMSCEYLEATMQARVSPRYRCAPLGEFEVTARSNTGHGPEETLARGVTRGCGAEWFFDSPDYFSNRYDSSPEGDHASILGPDGVSLPVDVLRGENLADNTDFQRFVAEHAHFSRHHLRDYSYPPFNAYLGSSGGGETRDPIRGGLPDDVALVKTCREDLLSGLFDGRRRQCIDMDNTLAAMAKWGRLAPPEQVDALDRVEAVRIARHWLQVHQHVQRGLGVQMQAEQLLGRNEAQQSVAVDVGRTLAGTVETVEAAMALMTQDAWETLLTRARPAAGRDFEGALAGLVAQSASMLASHLEQVRTLAQRAQEDFLTSAPLLLNPGDPAARIEGLKRRTVRMTLRQLGWLDHLEATAPQNEQRAFALYRHVRQMLVHQLAELMRPLGEQPPQVPLFFTDVVGTNGQYFASSDHLLGVARQAAERAEALYNSGVREGLLRTLQQGFVEEHADQADADRVADLKRHYGGEIGGLCGWQGMSGEDIIDRLATGELSLEECWVREDDGADGVDLDRDSAFRGQLGEAALALVAAGESLDHARRSHDDTETRLSLKTEQCKILTLSLAEDQQEVSQCAGLIAEAEAHRSDLRVGQRAVGFFGKFVSLTQNIIKNKWADAVSDVIGGVNQGLDDSIAGIDDLTRRAGQKLNFSLQMKELTRRSQACWDETALAAVGVQTELVQIRRVMTDLKMAKVSFDNRVRYAERMLSDCMSSVAQDATLPPQMARTLSQWFGADTALFARRLAWAKETAQQAAAALNFELQQTLVASGEVMAASTPAELERVVNRLQAARLTREVFGQRPASYSRFVSVRDEGLALADEGKLIAGGRSPSERLRARLALPAAAVYDGQGNYIGQGVRVVLSPNSDQQCGEKLWRVDVRLKADADAAGVPVADVLLMKSRVFSSQWCRPEEHRESPMQTAAAAHFRPEAGDDLGLAERRLSTANPAAQLQPRTDVQDRAFYQHAWGAGGSDAFAGQGLFGEYTVVFPPSNRFPLDAIDDLELRFDYVYVGRTHLRAAN